MPIFDSLVSPLLTATQGIISEFHLSPEQAVEAQQKLAAAAQQAQKDANDYDAQLNETAAKNIQAEESSNDKYTERARPTFMYIIEAIFVFNFIFLPIAQIFGSKVQPIALPGDLLTLFGICITGYVFARSAEKVAAMPGDSQINVLGMKVGNKS